MWRDTNGVVHSAAVPAEAVPWSASLSLFLHNLNSEQVLGLNDSLEDILEETWNEIESREFLFEEEEKFVDVTPPDEIFSARLHSLDEIVSHVKSTSSRWRPDLIFALQDQIQMDEQ